MGHGRIDIAPRLNLLLNEAAVAWGRERRSPCPARATPFDGRLDAVIAVTSQQLQSLPIHAHPRHGQWNYTIAPTGGQVAAGGDQERTRARTAALHLLADQRLTGIAATSWPRSPSCWPPHRTRRPPSAASNNAVDDAAGHLARAARACCPQPTGCWSPSSTCGRSARRTCCPSCWGSMRTPSARRSRRLASCSANTTARSPRPRCGSPPPARWRVRFTRPVRAAASARVRPARQSGPDRSVPHRARRDDRTCQARPRRAQRATPPPPPRRGTPARRSAEACSNRRSPTTSESSRDLMLAPIRRGQGRRDPGAAPRGRGAATTQSAPDEPEQSTGPS